MRVLVLGADGQLGGELMQLAWPPKIQLVGVTFPQVDFANPATIDRALDDCEPDVVVNAAAYTQVDRAESEPDVARVVNADAPGYLAGKCSRHGRVLIHVSTDYVFDGEKSEAYVESDSVHPQSVYGKTKDAGERNVRDALEQHFIVRTSWLFSATGQNFVKTIARLAQQRSELRVVADQVGCPTWARDLAGAIAKMVEAHGEKRGVEFGTYHYAGLGSTTWFEFAQAIADGVAKRWGKRAVVRPITTEEYGAPANRPRNSVLDCDRIVKSFGVERFHWKDRVDRVMTDLWATETTR